MPVWAWVAVVLALAAGVALGTFLGTRRQRQRLESVAAGAQALAQGNFAYRVILPGDDEIVHIAENLNRLADAIQREHETAAARDDARRQLLANISHDLRTPIASVAGYVDALQRGLGNQPERYLAVIAAKTEELAQLTDDLFYAARMDAGELELRRTEIDLAEAVRRSILGFEPQLSGMGVRVGVRIPDDTCLVEADVSAVARILSNLVSNSMRHGTGMTEIAVSMFPQDGDYVVRLTNDGSSLSGDPERLFERGVAGREGGPGLGLSISRELAERMGGSVTARNAAEGGVTFTLVLPKAAGEAS